MVCVRFLRLMVVSVLLACLLAGGSPVLAATATKPPIADAAIETDRSRVPEGKISIAVHVSLSPKWLNPQETPAHS